MNSQVCLYDYRAAACPAMPSCNPLVAGTGGAGFGAAVAMSGNLLAVGAPLQSGSAIRPFIPYEFSGTDWQISQSQPAAFDPSGANFGAALALDGDLLAVGAPAGNGGSGRARIYQYQNGNWAFLMEPTPPSNPDVDFSAATASFGKSVAVAGDLVAIAAPGATASGLTGAGAVVLYHCPAM